MLYNLSITFLTLLRHTFKMHMSIFYYLTKRLSLVRKSTMNLFFYKNPSIVFNVILNEVYFSMDNSRNDNLNGQYIILHFKIQKL
jgi:hypothetical protein